MSKRKRSIRDARTSIRQHHVTLGLAYSGDGLVDAGAQVAKLLDDQQGDAVAGASSAALQAQIALLRSKGAQPAAAAAEAALAGSPPTGIPLTPPVEDFLAEKGRLAAMLGGGFAGLASPTLDALLDKAELANEMGTLEVDFDGPPSRAVVTGLHGVHSCATGGQLVLGAGTYLVALDRNPPDYTPVSATQTVDVDATAVVRFTVADVS